MSALRHLGGPMPAVGTKLCTGFKANANFTSGSVIAAGDCTNGVERWVVVVQPDKGSHRMSLRLVTDIDLHAGSWRSIERSDESPDDMETQKRQREAWAAEAPS